MGGSKRWEGIFLRPPHPTSPSLPSDLSSGEGSQGFPNSREELIGLCWLRLSFPDTRNQIVRGQGVTSTASPQTSLIRQQRECMASSKRKAQGLGRMQILGRIQRFTVSSGFAWHFPAILLTQSCSVRQLCPQTHLPPCSKKSQCISGPTSTWDTIHRKRKTSALGLRVKPEMHSGCQLRSCAQPEPITVLRRWQRPDRLDLGFVPSLRHQR